MKVTDKLTVEFWFRPDVEKLSAENQTVLFTLHSVFNDQEYLTVYVEDGQLTCAPLGRESVSEAKLNYTGIDILTNDKWHHITCSYYGRRYVTG